MPSSDGGTLDACEIICVDEKRPRTEPTAEGMTPGGRVLMQAEATTPQRKYVLTKIAKQDYLLPSNDGTTLWRLRTYDDGPSYGIADWPRDVTFWGIWRWNLPLDPDETPDPDEWNRWTFTEGSYRTRSEAIAAALRLSDV